MIRPFVQARLWLAPRWRVVIDEPIGYVAVNCCLEESACAVFAARCP
jgi:hypothetical protein